MSDLAVYFLGGAFGAGIGVSLFGTLGARAVATGYIAAWHISLAVMERSTWWALLGAAWAFMAWRDVQIWKLDRRRKAGAS